jgi:hypothetical protein
VWTKPSTSSWTATGNAALGVTNWGKCEKNMSSPLGFKKAVRNPWRSTAASGSVSPPLPDSVRGSARKCYGSPAVPNGLQYGCGKARSTTLPYLTFYLQNSTFWRADERTRTADLLQLRVCLHAF